jgi:hypothetical protein
MIIGIDILLSAHKRLESYFILLFDFIFDNMTLNNNCIESNVILVID